MRRFVTFALNFSLIKRKTKEMEGLGNLKVNLIIFQVRICPMSLLEHSRSIIKLYLQPKIKDPIQQLMLYCRLAVEAV